MIRRPDPRRGFTLIELMIVVAIVAVLMTISAGAFVRYYLNARQRATETVLQIVDDQLMQRYDSFWKKVNPPPLKRHAFMAGLAPAAAATNEAQAVRYRRSRLIAKLEAMRGDFPQQFADFIVEAQLPNPPNGGLATCRSPLLSDNNVAVASRARAAIEAEYRRLTFEKCTALFGTGVPPDPNWVPVYLSNNTRGSPTRIAPHEHLTESAACLYLILKVGSGDGRAFDLASIPPRHIVDTDDDGVPEIVDAWGTPLRFYRWPTDLIHNMATVSDQIGGAVNVLDAGNSNNQNNLDPERLLYTTEWVSTAPGSTASTRFESNADLNMRGMGNFFWVIDHPNNPPPPLPGGGRVPFSYPIYPIIISAGPDAVDLQREDKWQAFGLLWSDNQGTAPTPSGKITTSWPPVDHVWTRCAAIAENEPGYPGAGAHVDNTYSRAMQAGREAQ